MTQPKLTLINGNKRPPTRLDWATVEQALAANGNEEEPRTLKFQRLVLNKLFDVPKQDADDHITDGGDDCGIDCFLIDYNNNKLHLISTKTVEAYDKARKNFPGAEVSKLICFVRDLVDHSDSLLTRCNPLLRAKVIECWESMAGGRVFQICVHVCSNQSHLIERESWSLHEGLNNYRAVVFEHHLTRFSEEISKNWSAPTLKSLRFIGRELFEHTEGNLDDCVKSLVGCVRVADLCEFLKDERAAFVDENLFHANVRGNLGIQNPVNRDIAATLRGKDNSKFFCLNNGITIVCERYLYQSGGFPVTLHRPQIVNGRQTAETIFNSNKQDPSGIANVVVSVRVIQTSGPAFIEEVSVATNSQSRIACRRDRGDRLGCAARREPAARAAHPRPSAADRPATDRAASVGWAKAPTGPRKAWPDDRLRAEPT